MSGRARAPIRVLQITDRASLDEATLEARIAASSRGVSRGAFAVQLRDPSLGTRALLDLGRRLRAATEAAGARLVVNDRVDLALALGADGVHLGRRSMDVATARALLPATAWISVACHDVEEVARAARDGADAALLSPIFASPGKGPPLGVAAITQARALAPGLEILALGGVTLASAPACFVRGASGVASIRADLTAVLDG